MCDLIRPTIPFIFQVTFGISFLYNSSLNVSSRGQGHPTGNSAPYFGPSRKLDFELEMVRMYGMEVLYLLLVPNSHLPCCIAY